jgi:hypothetical protein
MATTSPETSVDATAAFVLQLENRLKMETDIEKGSLYLSFLGRLAPIRVIMKENRPWRLLCDTRSSA